MLGNMLTGGPWVTLHLDCGNFFLFTKEKVNMGLIKLITELGVYKKINLFLLEQQFSGFMADNFAGRKVGRIKRISPVRFPVPFVSAHRASFGGLKIWKRAVPMVRYRP